MPQKKERTKGYVSAAGLFENSFTSIYIRISRKAWATLSILSALGTRFLSCDFCLRNMWRVKETAPNKCWLDVLSRKTGSKFHFRAFQSMSWFLGFFLLRRAKVALQRPRFHKSTKINTMLMQRWALGGGSTTTESSITVDFGGGPSVWSKFGLCSGTTCMKLWNMKITSRIPIIIAQRRLVLMESAKALSSWPALASCGYLVPWWNHTKVHFL